MFNPNERILPLSWNEKRTRWLPSSLRKISRYLLNSVGLTHAHNEMPAGSPSGIRFADFQQVVASEGLTPIPRCRVAGSILPRTSVACHP